MPKLSVTVPHQLGKQEATTRLQGILEKIRERYQDQLSDLQETWNANVLSFSFKTYGFGIKGTMTVDDSDVKIDGDLPFAAMMFKGKIETDLKNTLSRWLT
jgi:putative polyhydroxyalkanoic acid system protein